MKILIISSEAIDVSAYSAKFVLLRWEETDKTDINISDYDGVILDLDSIDTTNNSSYELYNFEQAISQESVLDVVNRLRTFVCVIGNPATRLWNSTLCDRLHIMMRIEYLSGDNIQPLNEAGDYFSYWKEVKSYDYLIDDIQIRNLQGTLDLEDSIKNISSHTIGVNIKTYNQSVLKGDLAFVPPLPKGKQKTIEKILDIYLEKGNSKEPNWAKSILVEGQDAIDAKISETEDRIEKLSKKLSEAEQERIKIRSDIEILYKSDKALEEVVKGTLSKIGFSVEEPPETNKVEFYIEHKDSKYVVEVKSTSKETFSQKGLRQVLEWKDDRAIETGEEYKPLLITSNQFKLEPNKRNAEILPDNLLKFATLRGIAVLQVTTLFEISQAIKRKKYSIEQFNKLLLETNGIVSFKP